LQKKEKNSDRDQFQKGCRGRRRDKSYRRNAQDEKKKRQGHNQGEIWVGEGQEDVGGMKEKPKRAADLLRLRKRGDPFMYWPGGVKGRKSENFQLDLCVTESKNQSVG